MGFLPISAEASIYLFKYHTPAGQSRVSRATQVRTDGVHCRESAATGPVVFKVVPVMGAAWQVGHHGPLGMRLSFPHPLQYQVSSMLKVLSEAEKIVAFVGLTSPLEMKLYEEL